MESMNLRDPPVFNVDDNINYVSRINENGWEEYIPKRPFFFPNAPFKRFVTCSLGKYDHPSYYLMDAIRRFFKSVLCWRKLPDIRELDFKVTKLDQIMDFCRNHKVFYNYGPNWFRLVAIPRDYAIPRPVPERLLTPNGIPTRVGNLSVPMLPPPPPQIKRSVPPPPRIKRTLPPPLQSRVKVEEIDDNGNLQPLVPRIYDPTRKRLDISNISDSSSDDEKEWF